MTLTLTAQPRTVTGKRVRALRAADELPLVLYGRGKAARSLQAPVKQFRQVMEEAGYSSLIDLKIDGDTAVKVLIQDVQLHPVSGLPMHGDLLEVDMAKKITAEVPLTITGEAPAVESLDGSLLVTQDMIEVECLPSDIPKEIVVDISSLATFDDAITAGSLTLPAGVTLVTDAELDLVLVQPPREEEEEPVSAEEAEKAAIEGVEAAAEAEKAEGEETTEDAE